MGVRNDISKNGAKVTSVRAPAALAATASEIGTGLDTAGYRRLALIAHAGVCTDGEYTITIETSATASGTYEPQTTALSEWVSGAAPTVITSAVDDQVFVYDINLDRLDNRYIKVTVTESSAGTTGVILGLAWVGELQAGV